MAHHPHFPAIDRYDSVTLNDYLMFYPQIENATQKHGSIDTLPRKTTMQVLVDFVVESFESSLELPEFQTQIDIQEEGTSLGTTFNTINFIGAGITATDAGSGVTNVTVSDNTILTDSGFATSLSNIIQLVGTGPISTSASGFTVTIDGANLYLDDGALSDDRTVDLGSNTLDIVKLSSPSLYDSGNSVRIHNIRIVSGYTTSNPASIDFNGWVDESGTADGVGQAGQLRWWSQTSSEYGSYTDETARIYREPGQTGTFEIASTGDIRLQPGGLTGTARELRLDTSGHLQLEPYGSGSVTAGTALYYLCVDADGNVVEVAI